MNELLLQDKYLINFLCERNDGLGYKEVKANTVSSDKLMIEEDLKSFIRDTDENKKAWKKLMTKFGHDENALMQAFMDFLLQRMKDGTNMAIFINTNKSVTFEGERIYLFYPSGSELHGDKLFEQNIFSVVQEMPYTFKYKGKKVYAFRPDVTFFVNGLYIGYTELKSNYNNQSAWKNGRAKVLRNYEAAVTEYLKIAKENDANESIKKDFLKIFHKAIHITSTDITDTYVIRTIYKHFDAIRNPPLSYKEQYPGVAEREFKNYPLRKPRSYYQNKTEQFEEVGRALYSKKMIEKEILYYNFIERELKKDSMGQKVYHDKTGNLIAPRPKQKFGSDKILDKIAEFLEHEQDDDYFINKLRKQLREKGLGIKQAEELITQRQKYFNNKNIYSLLLQYAAGFGKSNIIGWTALQLKDLQYQNAYVYDKIMLVVDRLQLRDQLDSKMFNMNISKSLFIEATDKSSFIKALESDTRIVVVNLQKFNAIREFLADQVLSRLANMRIAFLIDEIHRSHSGTQNEEMISLFDELQNTFDQEVYIKKRKKKNLIVGFTATPSDHTLTRFGEFDTYAEAERIWVPFDSYTMREAIEDGYILNPISGLVPVSAKMFYELPEDPAEGLHDDEKEYRIRKKKIYENKERIEAIARFVVERLVSTVYPNINGRAKAMLAVYSIEAAIEYHKQVKIHYAEIVQEKKKYERFKDAPIYIAYSSDGQKHKSAKSLNEGLTEAKVLQNFALAKNALIIVVDKLQTGFDERYLHTLFLDKEIRGINAIQTISRVNRTVKGKSDCKIVDFSYKNANIGNIRSAFEHFSNVVVSDFDPLNQEEYLEELYQELIAHTLFVNHFEAFVAANKPPKDVTTLLDIESRFATYIRSQADIAEELKKKVNKYFHVLHLIEFVIEIDKKYNEVSFLDFWKRYNNEYNNLRDTGNEKDDVEIYYDYKIGIVALEEPEVPYVRRPPGSGRVSTNTGTKTPTGQLSILEFIEKRNQEEEAIEQLIDEFRDKIELLYAFLEAPENGSRLIAKIRDISGAFEEEEIFDDFSKLYKRFVRRNRNELSEFFKRESKDILRQLFDDFEGRVFRN